MVISFTGIITDAGSQIYSQPRKNGYGYYESYVADPDGYGVVNIVIIVPSPWRKWRVFSIQIILFSITCVIIASGIQIETD